MKYSEKLNGYWEEGYHYYLEFRDGMLTVRDYRRCIAIETACSYDAAALERGERTVISLESNALSFCYDGSPMSVIKELSYENGEIKLVRCYLEEEETAYTLKKVDHGPFDHIIIRDDEFIDKLQGVWKQWHGRFEIVISGREIAFMPFEPSMRFHAISYKTSPHRVHLVPENLTDRDFGGFTEVGVRKDMLTCYMKVSDMSMPMYVFAREDMLDKITVPAEALLPARNTMTPDRACTTGAAPLVFGMQAPADGDAAPEAKFCPDCGEELKGQFKFCPQCGRKLI